MGPKSVQIPLDIAYLVAESAEHSERMTLSSTCAMLRGSTPQATQQFSKE